ncbi:MAG: septum formation family protein [Acidimicrobiales bacterium]
MPSEPQKSGILGGIAGGLGIRAILAVVVLGGGAIFGLIANRGTTEADSLNAGDCFVMPTASEFDRLDTEDCSAPHDGQIIGTVDVAGPTSYPSDFDPYWGTVYDACLSQLDAAGTRFEQLPEDTVFEFFSPVSEGWSQGDRKSLCYLYAPSGLDGSFVGS